MSKIQSFESYEEFLNREDKTINGYLEGNEEPILVDCESCWMCYDCKECFNCIRCNDCKNCLECNDLENRLGCRLLFKSDYTSNNEIKEK